MMASYIVTGDAYAKIAFHAAKYPHRPVNGVLIGKQESESVTLTDAIPLLHHRTNLSPSMEIGLDLARSYAESNGLNVVGFYQASEQASETSLSPVGEKVAEIIRKSFPNAVAFIVDASRLASGEPALIPYLPQGSSTTWKRAGEGAQLFSEVSIFRLSSPGIPSTVLRLIRESRLHQKLGDFDDHLEDVSIDWLRNSECNCES